MQWPGVWLQVIRLTRPYMTAASPCPARSVWVLGSPPT